MHISVRFSSDENFDPQVFVEGIIAHCSEQETEYGGPAVSVDGYEAFASFPDRKAAAKPKKKSAKKKR